MASKTLSTGTLSLRFMQNARHKQAQDAQLEKANVEDDGQWEIAKEIRDSWGVKADLSTSVSYDSSYLPFLFPSLPDPAANKLTASSSSDGPAKLKGRRVFRKGQEVLEQAEEPKLAEGVEAEVNADQEDAQPEKGKKTAMRLTMLSKSISGDSTGSLKPGKAITKSLPSAKLAIFDSSGVGIDLRSTSLQPANTSSALPNAFMKPAGVDEPNKKNSASTPDIVDGARAKKTDRKRSSTSAPNQESPQRKKKKSVD
ncbi:hypothetical protein WG66_005198 [Moniliophthora roreri]|nr:hypothetical protein WG66_005198 [Moniliophthora roreri]